MNFDDEYPSEIDQSNTDGKAYEALCARLFGGSMKSHRFEQRLAKLVDVIADQASVTPAYIDAEKQHFLGAVEALLRAYFMTPPLNDDPARRGNKTRLQILVDEHFNAAKPRHPENAEEVTRYQEVLASSNTIASRLYDDLHQFAKLTVERAIADGKLKAEGQAR